MTGDRKSGDTKAMISIPCIRKHPPTLPQNSDEFADEEGEDEETSSSSNDSEISASIKP